VRRPLARRAGPRWPSPSGAGCHPAPGAPPGQHNTGFVDIPDKQTWATHQRPGSGGVHGAGRQVALAPRGALKCPVSPVEASSPTVQVQVQAIAEPREPGLRGVADCVEAGLLDDDRSPPGVRLIVITKVVFIHCELVKGDEFPLQPVSVIWRDGLPVGAEKAVGTALDSFLARMANCMEGGGLVPMGQFYSIQVMF